MKACFMGLGYIGLPTAIIAAKHGVQILGVDINPKVVEMTNAGHLHIIEPSMEEMLQEVVKAGMLKASTTPEVSDAYFMVVPTPFKREPRTGCFLRGGCNPGSITALEGRRPVCDRIHFSCRHYRIHDTHHFQ